MFRYVIFSYALVVVLLAATTSHAAFNIPTGLNPGDIFHWAFVTQGTRQATSPDISLYNTFVQSESELSGSITENFGIDWFAIASTQSVDARDNAVVSAPVFLLDSTQIMSLSGPWISQTLLSAFDTDQFGANFSGSVWTGTGSSGVEAYGTYGLGRPLVVTGQSSATSYEWLDEFVWNNLPYVSAPLYALSEPLTVPTPGGGVIPEPASVVVWLGLASVLGVGTRPRRRVGRRA